MKYRVKVTPFKDALPSLVRSNCETEAEAFLSLIKLHILKM
jgi:hypothetical protein